MQIVLGGFIATLSSFSNQDSGGVLLFGIDETAGSCRIHVG